MVNKCTFILCFCWFNITGQSLQNQVIGALDGTATANSITLNQTIGELVVSNTTANNTTLQQGFQQGFTLSGIYWNGNADTNWSNALNWNGGVVPTTADKVILTNISSSPVLNSSSIITNLELKTNASLNILKEGALTINNNLTNAGIINVNSDASDSGVLLVKGISTGNITYNRGGLLMNKWSLLATPVKNQKIIAFAQNTANEIRKNIAATPNRFAVGYYNDANAAGNKWAYFDVNTNVADVFEIGTGYSLSRATDGTISFTGVLTSSDIVKNVVANQWNAIGNSFTSYYPINKNGGNNFLADNAAKLQIPAVYIWNNTQLKYVSTTNLVVDVAKFIPPGQGFFIKPSTNTTMLFDKTRRATKPTIGTHIFNKSTNATPFVKLFIKKGTVKVSTSVIYSETATKGFDASEDIENFGGAAFDINSHLVEHKDGKNYTTQSLPEDEIGNLTVPLHLIGTANNEITFSAETTNFPYEIKLYLEDRVTNTLIRLDVENSIYKITLTENSNETGRFYLRTSATTLFKNATALETATIYKISNDILRIIGLKNQSVYLKLYDLLGKQIFKTNFKGEIKNDIQLPNLKPAVYLVDLITEKGKISRKIIIE